MILVAQQGVARISDLEGVVAWIGDWVMGDTSTGTIQRSGGSCRFSKGRAGIGDPVKSMPKPRTECAVIDCATDLKQQIGAPSRPSHLLRFVHAPVDQEVRCALGDRRSDAQTGPVPFGVVDQPCGLALRYLSCR
jgi:hypothetical protein